MTATTAPPLSASRTSSSSTPDTAEVATPDTAETSTQTSYDYDLDALRSREPWAVRTWVYGERDLVRHVLMRHGVVSHELHGLIQEVMYQAIKSLPRFRGDSEVRTWLHSIAHSVAPTAWRPQRGGAIAQSLPCTPPAHVAKNHASQNTARPAPLAPRRRQASYGVASVMVSA
jgi:RNA polymerase sigma-70 factor (ECF subfamily)